MSDTMCVVIYVVSLYLIKPYGGKWKFIDLIIFYKDELHVVAKRKDG